MGMECSIMPYPITKDFIESNFPTLSTMTYLNNASTGIPPVSAINAMKQYLDDKIHAKGSFEETLQNFKAVRESLAELLGGREDQYAFVSSTSAGINSFAHSIQYPEGSNIVICDLEFPSNYIPWQNASRLYGVELRVADSRNGEAPLEIFEELVDENTRVLSISQTQFGSGFRADLRGLAKIVHDVNGYLVADIIQAAGWADTDLSKENVDFASGQAAKWLIGPIGAGYIYVADQILDKVTPRFLSWWGVKDIMNFSYADREPLPDAKMFQVGSPAMISYVGFMESLKLLLDMPAATRERITLENAEYLRKRLAEEEIGFYDFPEKNRSPIVSCKPDDVEELQKRLQNRNIHCSVRNGRLRISPHFYNTHEDIDALLDSLR
ncbi:MAG: aminotransferase class V-fold PLP-dependent enzyme [Candidatus Thorarchaeota archaeon]|nr:aminotransferase class V-fold PLP-dependent enzyme [Candidatus Thorarchaeota archaeon]